MSLPFIEDSAQAGRAAAVLTVDLQAIVGNWRRVAALVGPATTTAGVVKADAYGLGMARVAPALADAGCHSFFVATPDEALALRVLVPGASIYALGGPMGDAAPAFVQARITPVLNHPGDIALWAACGTRAGRRLPAAIHLDTGMNRLGLSAAEVAALRTAPERLDGIDVVLWMSHFACADEAESAMTDEQLARFNDFCVGLPRAPGSIAASSGIFRGPAYHLGLVRPGIALYGGNPTPEKANPMAGTVGLLARVLQVRDVDSPMTVGYGATHRVGKPGRIATIAVGYADGYLRSLSGRGQVYFGGMAAPVVGRISMDLMTVDVSAVPPDRVHPGAWAEVVGPHQPVDTVAAAAGTISYEILTSLGARYHRVYRS